MNANFFQMNFSEVQIGVYSRLFAVKIIFPF